jgi:Uma2 family endonuclease
MNAEEPWLLGWTREDYDRLCEQEWFMGRRVQLIGGAIYEFGPRYNNVAAGSDLTRDVLRAAFGNGVWVRQWGRLHVRDDSAPTPTLAVVPGSVREWAHRETPTTALLVVEVSDGTLAFDRSVKAPLYAASGIADCWILNLVGQQLEIYRDPTGDPNSPFGACYATRLELHRGDTIAPLAAPHAPVAVADLLP